MNRGKLIKLFRKEDGAGLVLALMVLMVLAVLGVAVASVTIGSHKLGHISRDSNSAYYIAEAGANLAYEEIKSGVIPAYENSANSDLNYFSQITQLVREVDGRTYSDFSDQFGDQPMATVTIEPTPSNEVNEYTIVSTGEINGTTRTVKKPFTVNWVRKIGGIGLPQLPDECAMYIGESISFPLSIITKATVRGDIVTHTDYSWGFKNLIVPTSLNHYKAYTNGSNKIKYGSIDMQPYYDLKDAFPSLPKGYEKYDEEPIFNSSNISVISANSVDDILRIGTLTVSAGNPLTIDTGNEERTINIIVRNLFVKSNINIIGDGTVNLFVTEGMEFTNYLSGLNVGGSTVDQLNILYSGNSSASFMKYTHFIDKSIVFTGTIFSKNASLHFYNNVRLEGIIVTFGSTLTMYDNVAITASIYAPRSEVFMWGGSTLKGTLVAKKMTFYGGVLLTPVNVVQYYLNDYLQTYPYGTGAGETPDLEELIFSQAAIEP